MAIEVLAKFRQAMSSMKNAINGGASRAADALKGKARKTIYLLYLTRPLSGEQGKTVYPESSLATF